MENGEGVCYGYTNGGKFDLRLLPLVVTAGDIRECDSYERIEERTEFCVFNLWSY